jgi:hypothetical protein
MADDGVVERAMVANGYTINQHGGAYRQGVAWPLKDKARVALVYLCLKEANPDAEVSIREVERLGKCSWHFAKKVADEIENDGHLVDPRLNPQQRHRENGVFTILEEDGLLLLALRKEYNWWTLRDYCIRLITDHGVFVSPSVICKWFNHSFSCKGNVGKLNQVPMDKFTPENVLRRIKHWDFIARIDPFRLKFGDEKPLKGEDLFNRKGRANPLNGEREPIIVDSDFRNTYNIIRICGIALDTTPMAFKMHDGINDSEVFTDFILECVAFGFLQTGDVLVLDSAGIHHYQDASELETYLWSVHGIFLHFLPTRSPELNPIKLLWNVLAMWLKYISCMENGNRSHQVVDAACRIMDAITHEDVEKCFQHDKYI